VDLKYYHNIYEVVDKTYQSSRYYIPLSTYAAHLLILLSIL
jgi:hypothetical protein